MPFRPSFDCLWCGAAHAVRDRNDLEGWAQLCPSCVANAGGNPFLRFRLKSALAERAAEAAGRGAVTGSPPVLTSTAAPDRADDFYLRRGAFARGPIHDAGWQAELDAAGRWLDGLPLTGRLVELMAGTGWWSTLLAGKGELTLLDESPARLERARARLVAHRLRAHLHVRDPWAAPDEQADVVMVGPAVAEVPAARLEAFAGLLHAWLRPSGLLAVIDLLPDGTLDAAGQPLGRPHPPGALPAALAAAGFTEVEVGTTGRCFSLVRARS